MSKRVFPATFLTEIWNTLSEEDKKKYVFIAYIRKTGGYYASVFKKQTIPGTSICKFNNDIDLNKYEAESFALSIVSDKSDGFKDSDDFKNDSLGGAVRINFYATEDAVKLSLSAVCASLTKTKELIRVSEVMKERFKQLLPKENLLTVSVVKKQFSFNNKKENKNCRTRIFVQPSATVLLRRAMVV